MFTTRTRWSWLCGCALALAACSQSATGRPDGGPGDGADLAQLGGNSDGGGDIDQGATLATLKVAIDDPANLDGPTVSSIDVMTVRDLLMRLSVPTLPASDPTFLTFKLQNPSMVQVQDRRFAFATDAQVTMAVDPSDPTHTLPVSTATMKGGTWALDFSIPVGGTNLQKKPMPGTWLITVDVDGHPEYHVSYPIEFTAG
jgi:hypothetical protein